MSRQAPKIKFCGVARLQDAQLAADLGAWAIGLNFWPKSPRKVQQADAAEIAAAVKRRVEVAGVFVNAALDQVVETADAVGLTMLQFHGEEGPAYCGEAARRTGCRVIKAARVRSRADIQALAAFHTDYHLLDSHVPGIPGGTGEVFSWEIARSHRGSVPLILSGGLTPENVAEAISVVRPYAVDVASGVEVDGGPPTRKDPERMRAFTEAVVRAAGTTAAGAAAS